MTADLTLWGIGTPRTMRAHWMLEEFGLAYECRPIQSRSGETMTSEFLALNPKHKIPVLRHGGFVLSESAAIVSYLSEAFAPPAGFYVPRDAAGRARLDEWRFFIMTELDALSLYVIRRHQDLHALYGEAPNAVAAAKAGFAEQAGAVFKSFGGGNEFVMPEGMSVADILLATCVDGAMQRGIALPPFLSGYMSRMAQRPAYRAAFARNFPHRRAAAGG
jgi:glutathione S-transferase